MLKMLKDNVAVENLEVFGCADWTGDITLPENAKISNRVARVATVVEVGSEASEFLKPGDKVLLHGYKGFDYEHMERILRIYKYEDILGIV